MIKLLVVGALVFAAFLFWKKWRRAGRSGYIERYPYQRFLDQRLACAHEGIDPQQPSRLPLLFAMDSRLAIAGGFVYQLDCLAGGKGAAGSGFCASHIGCGSGGSGDAGSSDGGGDGGSGCGGGCGGGD